MERTIVNVGMAVLCWLCIQQGLASGLLPEARYWTVVQFALFVACLPPLLLAWRRPQNLDASKQQRAEP